MQHLIIVLDESAPSFCCYHDSSREPKLMGLDLLKEGVLFARKQGMAVNILTGKKPVPDAYMHEIKGITHLFITALDLYQQAFLGNCALIVHPSDFSVLQRSNDTERANLILRIAKEELSHLNDFVLQLEGKFKRLNVCLLDVDQYQEADFNSYRRELTKIRASYLSMISRHEDLELNILSDRLGLSEMNNCQAGVEHITLAPNGQFYICPAFYENNEDSIGSLSQGLLIPNAHLLKLDNAPICRRCDAYQCHRCVWLNQKTTLELNTPSHEQCVLAHLERNATRQLRQTLGKMDSLDPQWTPIPKLDYLDPLELFEHY